MKKSILLALAGFLLAGSLSACSGEGNTFEAKSYTPEGEEISGIDIQAADREILVVPSEDGQFHIDYAESEKEFYDIFVSDSGVLTMVAQSEKEWTDYIGGSKSAGANQITVQVPDAALAALSLRTTNEDISLSALTVTGQLTLSNNGGDISFENVGAPDAVTVENKNGDITGAITGSYDDYAITCAVKKGESSLPDEKSGGSKTLSAANNNGDIEIEFISE